MSNQQTTNERFVIPELPDGCVYNHCTVEVVRYVDQETFLKNGQHDAFIGKGKTPKDAYWDAMEKLNGRI